MSQFGDAATSYTELKTFGNYFISVSDGIVNCETGRSGHGRVEDSCEAYLQAEDRWHQTKLDLRRHKVLESGSVVIRADNMPVISRILRSDVDPDQERTHPQRILSAMLGGNVKYLRHIDFWPQ
jgi:hypothetical protein